MTPSTALGVVISGRTYRIRRTGRARWEADCRCDCMLGPHWHSTGLWCTSERLLVEMLQRSVA